MAGMGIAVIDFHTMLSVLSLKNIFAVILIVVGAVLGAAKRMNLMRYAQISSRIGGTLILLIGSIIFSFL